MSSNMQYEEPIVIKDLCRYLLKKWRLFLVAAIAGAVLLGGYQAAVNLFVEPELVMSEEELLNAETTIETNETALVSASKEIATLQADLNELYKLQREYDSIAEALAEKGLSDTQTISARLELDEKKASVQAQISSKRQRIRTLNDDIFKRERDNTELLAKTEETASHSLTSGVAAKVFVGAVLGLVLMFAGLFLRYYFDKALRSPDSLTVRFGLPLLGSLYEAAPGRGKEPVDAQRQCAAAAAKIQLLAGEDRVLLVTGTVQTETLETVCAALRANLPGYELLLSENPVEHPELLLQKKPCRLVLVEKVHGTNVDDLQRLLEFLHISDTPVVGAIAV